MSWGILVITILCLLGCFFLTWLYWQKKDIIETSTKYYGSFWRDFLHQHQGWLILAGSVVLGCLGVSGLIILII